MTYTAAQLLAFAWLPEDGSWRSGITSSMGLSMKRLKAPDLDFVQRREKMYGDQGGPSTYFRLTAAGIAERKRLVEEGLIG
jgi:hypothetical protein